MKNYMKTAGITLLLAGIAVLACSMGYILHESGGTIHAILNTAYPGKRFFDRLTEVEIGDRFSVTVLGETLNYKVVDIKIVLPSETQYFEVQKGRDLVTLVTCTPYSVNTHRLLVTGERDNSPTDMIEAEPEVKRFNATSSLIWGIVPLMMAIIFVTVILIRKRRKRHET
jgi:sortase A